VAAPSSPADATHAAGGQRGLAGVCAAPGLAVGPAARLDQAVPEIVEQGEDVTAERARLQAALVRVGGEIALAIESAARRGARTEGEILGAHQALLEDPEIIGEAQRRLTAGQSARFAFHRAVSEQCERLAALGNPLLGERVADLRDLERRVLRATCEQAVPSAELPAGAILLADDLGPSDLLRVPRDRLAGVATARGGATSHVAILARALGIPALAAVGPGLLDIRDGTCLLLDASSGRIEASPAAAALEQARAEMVRVAARRAEAAAQAQAPATTRDGHRIEVAANIASEEDARQAARSGADGVGLLRTELLFIDRPQAPSREEQARVYQAVVDALEGRPVIIRTLDAGNDKELAYLTLPSEPNPALGTRGIRIGFAHPEMLDTQLEALLAVRPARACRIMLPMISDLGELLWVRQRLDELASRLGLTERPELGIMIEVPSAALLAEQLARVADFLSIGTNDLTQYTLAMDRCSAELASRIDGLHPAVLRLIAATVEGAQRHGRWVGVCGAMASDLEAVPALLGLGVTELSVSPAQVPEVKARVRGLELQACRQEAARLCELASASEVRARLRQLWPVLATARDEAA
jgi:phosphoenolpyruvate-protein phosphotransferase